MPVLCRPCNTFSPRVIGNGADRFAADGVLGPKPGSGKAAIIGVFQLGFDDDLAHDGLQMLRSQRQYASLA